MTPKIRHEWHCPKCNQKNVSYIEHELDTYIKTIKKIYCQIESGGCEEMFFIEFELLPIATIYEVKRS